MTGDLSPTFATLAPFGASRRPPSDAAAKARRNEAEQAAADALLSVARASRESFLAAHVEPIYGRLTERGRRSAASTTSFTARRRLCRDWSRRETEVDAEATHLQGEKDGVEIDQGLFLAHVLARPLIGEHLCHAMLLPRPESEALPPNSPLAARSILARPASRDAARPSIST